MAKNTRKLKGGKYIYHGSYGCAYKPAMKCQGDKERIPNAISKIMNKEDAKEEFQKRFLLQPVDPRQQFFLWPKRLCSVRPRDLTAENDLDPCPRVDDVFQKSLKDAALLIYGDGGTNLNAIDLQPSQYREFFKGFEQLFEGLALLHSRDIVHLDIKPTNIVAKYTNRTFQFHYIDFGFTTKIADYDKEGVPNAIYKYWPYEMKFSRSSFGPFSIVKSSVNEWSDNLDDSPELEGLEDVYVDDEKRNYSIYRNFGENRETRMVPLLKAVDVFSLGVTLLSIYYSRIGHRIEYDYDTEEYGVDVVDDIKNGDRIRRALHFLIMREISRPFLSLVAKMVTIHLDERITAQQAYEEFKAIQSNFDLFTPSVVNLAFRDLDIPPTPSPPPTPETPGFDRIQTSLFASTPVREATELNVIKSNVFTGGRRKTQRKRR